MLQNISTAYVDEAHMALQWLACSVHPLTIEELAEAAVLDPGNDCPLNIDNRYSDSFEILHSLTGLVTVNKVNISPRVRKVQP